jgi:hypothetical protein
LSAAAVRQRIIRAFLVSHRCKKTIIHPNLLRSKNSRLRTNCWRPRAPERNDQVNDDGGFVNEDFKHICCFCFIIDKNCWLWFTVLKIHNINIQYDWL